MSPRDLQEDGFKEKIKMQIIHQEVSIRLTLEIYSMIEYSIPVLSTSQIAIM